MSSLRSQFSSIAIDAGDVFAHCQPVALSRPASLPAGRSATNLGSPAMMAAGISEGPTLRGCAAHGPLAGRRRRLLCRRRGSRAAAFLSPHLAVYDLKLSKSRGTPRHDACADASSTISPEIPAPATRSICARSPKWRMPEAPAQHQRPALDHLGRRMPATISVSIRSITSTTGWHDRVDGHAQRGPKAVRRRLEEAGPRHSGSPPTRCFRPSTCGG